MESNKAADGYESYIRDQGGHHTLALKIGGVHCAACIQKIESTLHDDADVSQARLNFTSGALNIVWDGKNSRANDFVSMITKLGYQVSPYDFATRESDSENKFLLMCMGVSGFAAANVMLLSFGLWITNQETMGFATREFFHMISALIAVPAIIFAGRPFFGSAWQALKNKRTNMDVPISLALILATGMSLHELWRGAEHVYFDSALMLMFFLLIGRYLDFRARSNARSAATDLMSTLRGFATVIEGAKTRRVPIRDVKANMLVQVAVGEKFPVDGHVEKGTTSVDTSLVTGETMPRDAKKGDEVFAGTINLDAPVTIRVSKAADDSLLADIVRLMDQAGQSQAAYTRLADRAARLYTPLVHTLAAAAFILWFFIIGIAWQDALMIAVTVLIITCPCALGLAVPVAQVLATGRLMKDQILVKSGDALERLAVIDTVFLDKTGTLTNGRPTLVGEYDPDALMIAASLAKHSTHPLSQAVVKVYGGDTVDVTDVKEIAGKGIEADYNGKIVRLGSRKWCGDVDAADSDGLEIWLKSGKDKSIRFAFSDQLRIDAKDVLAALKSQGLHIALLSGDRDSVVTNVAKQAGIEEAIGDMTPPDKFAMLQNAKQNGHKVLMVGDGLNDAPVLAGADVSMAPGTAIDMAQNAADIVFMGDTFSPVLVAYKTAVKTQKLIRQNFVIAILYNMVAIPLAFTGMVTPMIAAIAMSGSSILVILNSFRLRLKS